MAFYLFTHKKAFFPSLKIFLSSTGKHVRRFRGTFLQEPQTLQTLLRPEASSWAPRASVTLFLSFSLSPQGLSLVRQSEHTPSLQRSFPTKSSKWSGSQCNAHRAFARLPESTHHVPPQRSPPTPHFLLNFLRKGKD